MNLLDARKKPSDGIVERGGDPFQRNAPCFSATDRRRGIMDMKISRRAAMLAAGFVLAYTTTPAVAQNALENARAAGKLKVACANEASNGFTTADGKITGTAPEAQLFQAGYRHKGRPLFQFADISQRLAAHGTPTRHRRLPAMSTAQDRYERRLTCRRPDI